MGKGSSSSETTQSTATTSNTTDARVGADNGSTVIQAGGQQNISFSPEVAQAAGDVIRYNSDTTKSIVNSIVDFSGQVLSEARSIITEGMMVQQQATEGALDFGKTALAASPVVAPAASQAITTGQQTTSLKPLYIIGAIGAIGLIFLLIRKK